MKRRELLGAFAASSTVWLLPATAKATILTHRREIALECLGNQPGARFLDGRTGTGAVDLVQRIRVRTFPGTKWVVFRDGNSVHLQCRSPVNGPRWLDGRTVHGTVGLAPDTAPPFTGTRWEVVEL